MDLIKFWFQNEKIWFQSTPQDDILIENLFLHQLNSIPLSVHYLINIKYTHRELLNYIILTDQISRHIYRNNLPKISFYHKIALNISYYMIEKGYDTFLNDKERCFLLMPIRHTFELPELYYVINKLNEYIELDQSKYYFRFLKATFYSLSKIISKNISVEPINHNIKIADIVSILDCKSCKYLIFNQNKNNGDGLILNEFINLIRKMETGPEKIVLSISGGVDSMVSSHILKIISKKIGIEIIAVMINYGNRGEICKYEVEFVKRWCKLLDIKLYVRHITELLRSECTNKRNDYEKITRQFRFDMYSRFGAPVILGHNFDDGVENIFANIKKRKFENLIGMSDISEERGCKILRPMLKIRKSEILEYAKNNNVPYLFDSTPSWSARGKMRDILIPSINNFDVGIINGLNSLSTNYREITDILIKQLIPNFYKNGSKIKKSISFDNAEMIVKSSFFMNQLLNLFRDDMQLPNDSFVTTKSVYSMINLILNRNRMNTQPFNIEVNKYITIKYHPNLKILTIMTV